MALTPGTRVGPYEVLAQIGVGGMGEVYKATDTNLKRAVAIKVLPASVAGDAERLARFQREAEVLAALNHPNIAQIHGLEKSDGTIALVMELVEGPTLADRIAQGAIPLDEALPVAKQIADALEAAHEKGIIHRDLKPANIKVRPDGTVKVLDFGLAKAMEPTAGSSPSLSMSPTITTPAMTQAGMILGTAAYMSPEQARGKTVDKRADIWAFGVVLFEMLTGTRAFEGEDITDTLSNVMKVEPSWQRFPASVSPHVVQVIRACLRKNPRQRIDSAQDVRLALEGAFETSDSPPGATAARPLWRRAIPVTVALVVGGLVAGYGAWRLKPEPVRAVMRFPVPLSAGQGFTNGGRQLVALAPDGSNLVYVANQRLYLRSMSSLEAHVIPGSEFNTGLTSPVFSPDGQSLAFYVGDRTLKRLATSGGVAVTICPAAQNVYGMSWDDSGIVFGQPNRGILRVSPNGGTPEVIATVADDELASNPQMLPGGEAVLFSLKKNRDTWAQGHVVVQAIPTGIRKTLINAASDGRYVPTGHLVYAVSGVLLAVPFDLQKLSVSGGSVPILEGIRRTGLDPGGTGTAQFSYSTSGSMAYVPGPGLLGEDGQFRLALFDRKNASQLLDVPPGRYVSPRASPDGRSIAVDTDDGKEAVIWIYNLSGASAIRRLTFGGKNRAPVWSPDGQWIVFQSDREGDFAIYRQRADGSGAADRLTKPDAGAAHIPDSWSPDGAHLLFTVQKDQQFTLWVLSMNDRRVTRFGDLQSTVQFDATFSPDGQWVAYQSRESPVVGTNNGVYLQSFPGAATKYLVPRVGGHPLWMRSGELILNAAAGTSSTIAVKTTPQVVFGQPMDSSRGERTEPNPATNRRAVDALPDGEHVIGLTSTIDTQSDSVASQSIVVTLDWFEELKRLVPTK